MSQLEAPSVRADERAKNRVGVVGIGQMGENHVRTIAAAPDLELVGVADRDEARLEEIRRRYDAKTYLQHEDLYKQPLDGVVVATPEDAHIEPTVDAAALDYDILLEKPLAEKRDQALEIVRACSTSKSQVLMGFTLRFDTAYASILERARAGEFGEVVSVAAERSVITEEAHRMSRSHPLLYQTIHDMEVICQLASGHPERVYAEAASDVFHDEEVTDVIFSTVSFTDGTIGCIETGSILPTGSPAENRSRLDVKGTDGGATLRNPGSSFEVVADDYRTPDARLFATVEGRIAGALRTEISHFANILKGDVPPRVTLADAARAEEIARGTLRSIESGQPERVEQPVTAEVA